MRIQVGDRGAGQLTVDEIVSDGGAVTDAVVVNVAILAIEVFGDGDQIANGRCSANVTEEFGAGTLETNLFEGLQPFLHNRDLGFEVLKVGCVVEAILDVEQGIDDGPVPKCEKFVERVETIDKTGARSRSKQRRCRAVKKRVTHVVKPTPLGSHETMS